MKRIVHVGSLCLWVLIFCVPHVYAEVKTDSIVKIIVSKNRMDYVNPWQSHGGDRVNGSGCIITGNRILTNAHVVNDSTFIQVRREADPKRYTATVEAIGNDSDLAILTVDDPDFFKGVEPLEFSELPNLQESVTAFGYPMGGDVLSITEGVVSRVEIIRYAQSNRPLLGVQIDAAINPGNSGGPVLKDGKIVGIAMQVLTYGQNIGYMIPTSIVNHFLNDLKDNNYDGVPLLGISYHNTENEAMREYYSIPENAGGVIVTHIAPFLSADGILKEEDIILELDGVSIESDGSVPFRGNERLVMSYLINSKQVGDAINVRYLRKGKIDTVKIKLKAAHDLVPTANYFKKPSYYIYGGLVFTVLSTDLLNEWRNAYGPNSENRIPVSFRYWAYGVGQFNEKRNKDIVMLSEVLPDAINVGYHDHQSEIITKVNGQAFTSFKEFVHLVEANQEVYVQFENEAKHKLLISAEDAKRVADEIIKRHHIPSRYSEDVAEWLE